MVQKPLILAVETSSRIGSVAIALGERILAEAAFSGPMRHSAELFPATRSLLDRFNRKPREIEHIYISIGPGSFTGLRIAVTMAKAMNLANAAKIVAVDTLDVIAANVIGLATDASSHQPPASSIEYRLSAIASAKAGASLVRRSFSEGGSIENIAAVLDAKRGQFFIAVYQRTAVRRPAESDEPRHSEGRDEPQEARDGIWKKTLPDSLMTASQFLNKFTAADQPVWLLGDGLVYYKDKFKADGVRFLDEQYWSPRAAKVHLLGYEMSLKGQFTDPLTLQPAYLRCPDVKIKPR